MIKGDKGMLTPSEREYYDELERFFESKGWEIMSARAREELQTMPERAFQHASSYEELQTARARFAALAGVLSWPAEIAAEAESIIQGRESRED